MQLCICRGAEAAFCGAASLPLLNLVGFNCYLIAKNLTTAEEFHQPYGSRNPFSEGKPCAYVDVNIRTYERIGANTFILPCA